MTVISEDVVPVRIDSTGALGEQTTKLEIAGMDLTRLTRSVKLSVSVDAVNSLSVEMLALHGLDITIPAQVTINIVPLEGGVIEATTMGDGIVRYRLVTPDLNDGR